MRVTDVGGQVVAVDPRRRRPARRHDVVVGGVAPAHGHPRRAQRERRGGQRPRLGELALTGDAGEPVEDVGGAQREPHRAAVLEGGEVRRGGLVEVAEADERAAEQQPRLDAVAPEPRGVGQRDHVGGEAGGLAQLAADAAGRDRPARAPGAVRPTAGSGGRPRSACHVGSSPRRRVSASRPTRSSASSRASSTTARVPATASAMRPCSSAIRARRVRAERSIHRSSRLIRAGQGVAGRLRGLGEAALGGVDVGEGPGGLAPDRTLGVEVERAPGLALGELHLAGVEVHLGPDGRGLGQLLLRPRGRRGVLVGAVQQPEALVGPAHLGGGDPGAPGDLGADRRRTVAAGHGGLEDLDGVTRAHRGVERGEDPVGHRVALGARLRLRARGEHGVAHRRQVLEPVGVGGAVVVVGGCVVVGPAEQAGLDRRHVVGPRQGAGAAADGGEHVEASARRRPRARLRRTRLPATSAARGAGWSSTRASTPSPMGKSSSPIRRSAVALSSSSRSWAESTAWSRLTVDIALLSPTSADCTATCSMRSGSPPVARSRRRTSWSCGRGRPAGRPRPGSGAGTARRRGPRAASGGRAPGAGRPGRRTRRAGRRWSARSPRPGRRSCSSSIVCSIGPGVGRVEVEAVEHQQAVAAVDGAAQGAGERVAGGGLGVEALAAPRRGGRRGCAGCARRPTTSATPAATWRTMSVLPLPGGPTTVTQRDSSSASLSARWTSSRPRHGESTGRTYR